MQDGITGRRWFWPSIDGVKFIHESGDMPLQSLINPLTPLILFPNTLFDRFLKATGFDLKNCNYTVCIYDRDCSEMQGPPVQVMIENYYFKFFSDDYFLHGPRYGLP